MSRLLITLIKFVALSALSALVFNGCRTSYNVEIDLRMATPIDPASADSQWALLTWCLESRDGQLLGLDDEELEEIKDEVGRVIFLNWSKRLKLKYPFLDVLDNDLFFTGQVENKELIQDALDALDRPIKIYPSLDGCRSFLWTKNLINSRFPDWLSKYGDNLYLPEHVYGDRKLAQRKLMEYSEGYLTEHFVRRADEFLKKGDYETSFAELSRLIRRFPENEKLIATINAVGDAMIGAHILSVRTTELAAAENGIANFDTVSESLDETDKLVAAAENRLAALLSSWMDDLYLRHILENRAADKAAGIQKDVAVVRSRLWRQQIKRIIEKQRYWHAYDTLRQRFHEISDRDSIPREAISSHLWDVYFEHLPACLESFISRAGRELEQQKRYGTTLLLCRMVGDLIDFAKDGNKAIPTKINELSEKVEALEKQSMAFFRDWISRELILCKFTSGEPGLGTTFLRDLEILFRKRLDNSSLVYGVKLAGENTEPDNQDYSLDKCNVAAFTVDKAPPEESLELFTRNGEIIEKDNPEYLDRIRKKRITTGIPPKIITQTIYKYTKHTSVVEVVVHARLTFTLNHRDQEKFFEINKFLKKTFVKETIDPRETIIRIEKVVGPEEPEPELRDDDIWVASEMKDWARRQSQEILVMEVMRYIAEYPHMIADIATSYEGTEKWPEAANYWGFCLEYCRMISPDTASLTNQLADSEISEHARKELDENLKTVEKLVELKNTVWHKATNAVTGYLEPAIP